MVFGNQKVPLCGGEYIHIAFNHPLKDAAASIILELSVMAGVMKLSLDEAMVLYYLLAYLGWPTYMGSSQ